MSVRYGAAIGAPLIVGVVLSLTACSADKTAAVPATTPAPTAATAADTTATAAVSPTVNPSAVAACDGVTLAVAAQQSGLQLSGPLVVPSGVGFICRFAASDGAVLIQTMAATGTTVHDQRTQLAADGYPVEDVTGVGDEAFVTVHANADGAQVAGVSARSGKTVVVVSISGPRAAKPGVLALTSVALAHLPD